LPLDHNSDTPHPGLSVCIEVCEGAAIAVGSAKLEVLIRRCRGKLSLEVLDDGVIWLWHDELDALLAASEK
jgi:hypothetical protein